MATFTSDAILRKLIFSDDFNRTTVAPDGPGGTWIFTPYDSRQFPSQASGVYSDGSALVVPAGNQSYESYIGFPVPIAGEAYYDFFVPAAWTGGHPTYGLLLDSFDYLGLYVEAENGGDFNFYQFGGDTPLAWTPTPSTWYRVHAQWDGTTVNANVWERANPEPAGWAYSEPQIFDPFGPDGEAAILDLYFAPNSEDGHFDNLQIWTHSPVWTGYGALLMDAEIVVPPGGSFTMDAVLAQPGGTFTADAIRRQTMGNGTTTLPAYQSVATGTGSGGGAVTSVPSGVAAGDLILTFISFDAVGNPASKLRPSTAGFFTLLSRAVSSDGDQGIEVWARVATGSEGSFYSFSSDGPAVGDTSAVSIRITNADPVWLSALAGSRASTASGTNHSTDSIIIPTEGLLVVGAGGSFIGTTWTPPSGMTERGDVTFGFSSMEVSTQAVTAANAGVKTAVSSNNVIDTLAWVVVPPKGRIFRVDAFVFDGKSFTIDAQINTRHSSSFRVFAQIASYQRQQHPRDDTAHYGVDHDVVVTLAGAVGVYQSGDDLEDVLDHIEQRITALENS